ncbi:MAG: adenylate/guanylate cyclase domain-containing protein [Spirochaetales bacterium]|nr:adenylate/guanylate cyclase domain-containing protein [Spirochaetales bacterium]
MGNIEDLLKKRKEILKQKDEEIQNLDEEIKNVCTKPVTLLFTDIVGSTKYFETMGDIEGRYMIETHNNLLFPIITSFDGTIIKTIGDSIMASFNDPVKGVQCAIKMQKELKKHNNKRKPGERINVRMGLHYGEAVVDDKDLFGDMVNTSARVEARANGEEILISSSLKEKIEEHYFPLIFLGSEFVKGKKGKIDFYLVNWDNKPEEEIKASWKQRIEKQKTEKPEKDWTTNLKKQKVVIRITTDLGKLADEMKPPGKKGNPYLNRVMIPHPDMFFGRRGIVKRIMGRISAESPQSVSIVGERRIGKSSLLKYLNFPGTRLEYLDEPGRYLFLFIDFQQLRTIDENQFIGILFTELAKQPGYEVEISCEKNHDGILFLCEQIVKDGYKFILFFDEFESVTKNEKIEPDFYSFFRSLANNYPLAFITASGKNLKDMCVSHEISDSPFFNIFAVHYLNLFNRNEAGSLITIPSEERGVPLEPLAGRILETGGLYPFFLQMCCSAWFDFLETEECPASDFTDSPTPREVLTMFREESYPHFEYVCETLGKKELGILKNCVQGNKVDAESYPAEILERKGYVMRDSDETLKLFSKEFEIFVKKRYAG